MALKVARVGSRSGTLVLFKTVYFLAYGCLPVRQYRSQGPDRVCGVSKRRIADDLQAWRRVFGAWRRGRTDRRPVDPEPRGPAAVSRYESAEGVPGRSGIPA